MLVVERSGWIPCALPSLQSVSFAPTPPLDSSSGPLFLPLGNGITHSESKLLSGSRLLTGSECYSVARARDLPEARAALHKIGRDLSSKELPIQTSSLVGELNDSATAQSYITVIGSIHSSIHRLSAVNQQADSYKS